MTRSTTNVVHLLNLQYKDENKPLLPLNSDDPLAYENSPLAALRPRGTSSSEMVSQLFGPGPWPIRAKLHLPADCKVLHPTSRSRESNIHVTHALCLTMRLSRGDDSHTDSKSGKRKYEVVVRTPVHILSVRFPSLFNTLLDPLLTCGLVDSATRVRNTPRCRATLRRLTRAQS